MLQVQELLHYLQNQYFDSAFFLRGYLVILTSSKGKKHDVCLMIFEDLRARKMEKMELRAVNGVTVTGPTRICSNAGTFCWTSGPFVTIAEGERGLENADYVSVKVKSSSFAGF